MRTTNYDEARQAYWDAQTAFRREAIHAIEALIPEGVTAVVLEMSDDWTLPRLRFTRFIYKGDVEDEFDYEADEIDAIASDMEMFNYDEAHNLLLTDGSGGFIIEKASVNA